jgi:hypothetical protein
MNTVVVDMKLDPDRAEDVDRHLREDVVGWAKGQPGFISGQWLRLAGGDHGMGVLIFASEEQANAAAGGPRSQPWVEGRAWNTNFVTVFETVAQA